MLTSPLRFPENRDLRVERYLSPYGFRREPDQDINVSDFASRLAREDKWYGIMSAMGTGKTTLLHDLIFQLESERNQPVLALPRIDLGIYRGEADVDRVLGGLSQEIADGLKERQQPSPPSLGLAHGRAEFVPWLETAVRDLFRGGRAARVLLSLDNFERLEPEVQRALPEQLKKLHEDHRERVTCLIATDMDLQKTGRDLSPLHGILDLYTLLDYSRAGEWEQLEEIADNHDLHLTAEAWAAVRMATGGCPFWVSAILGRLPAASRRAERADVEQAMGGLEETRPEPRPVEQFLQVMETWAESRLPERVALGALSGLLKGPVPLNGNEAAFEALALKGIVRADGNGNIAFRNTLIEHFVRKHRSEVEENANPELRLGHLQRARGKIHVTLVLNLSRFIRADDKSLFDELRGTQAYAEALEELEDRYRRGPEDKHAFELRREDDRIRNIGTDLYIFTHQAAEGAFTGEYHLKEPPKNYRSSSTFRERIPDDAPEPQAYATIIRAEWTKWNEMSVQLTREGTAIVRLVRVIGKAERPPNLFSVMEDVLGLEGEISTEAEKEKAKRLLDGGDWIQAETQVLRMRTRDEAHRYRQQVDRSVQWEIGMSLVESLIREVFAADGAGAAGDCSWEIGAHHLRLAPGGERPSGAAEAGLGEPIYPLRDRYVIFEFDKLCDCPDHDHSTILEARDFADPQRAREIAGLLEGVAIGHSRGQGFPNLKEAEARKQLQRDLATWQGELCLVTIDNALVYYKLAERQEHPLSSETATDDCDVCPGCYRHEKPVLQHIYFPGRGRVAYADYWSAVVRGMEYVVGLRLVAQLVAQRTGDYLAQAADLSRLLGDGATLSKETRDQVLELRGKTANAARLLSVVRGATIPLSIARSDYASRKFESLIRQSGIRMAVRSAEGNLRDLNAFLVHYDDVSMEASNKVTLKSIEELTDKSQQGNIAAITVSIIIAFGLVISIWAQILQNTLAWWFLIIASAVLVGVMVWVALRVVNRQMQEVDRRHHPEKYNPPRGNKEP